MPDEPSELPAPDRVSIRFEPDGSVSLITGTQTIGQGHETTFPQILADRLGKPIEPNIPGEYRPGEMRALISDITKIGALGFAPEVDLETGIDRYLAWIATQGTVAEYFGAAERDAAYHQGTAWPWLLGPFVEAWVRVHGGTADVKRTARERFLRPLLERGSESGLGHLPEIADAESPHAPRGCPFQAWSVGEALRLDRVVLA